MSKDTIVLCRSALTTACVFVSILLQEALTNVLCTISRLLQHVDQPEEFAMLVSSHLSSLFFLLMHLHNVSLSLSSMACIAKSAVSFLITCSLSIHLTFT